MNTNNRSTSIVLDALVRLQPDNDLIPNVVRWLMVSRQDGHWETTQENVWALIALNDVMVSTGELGGARRGRRNHGRRRRDAQTRGGHR